MTRLRMIVTVGAVVVPFVAFLAAMALLWSGRVSALEVALLAVMYSATVLGVTVGYHRLLTHRAFETRRAVRCALTMLGSMAVEGSVLEWVADHRKHHAFSDRPGDPHSPHGHGEGVRGLLRGMWHAHTGWLFGSHGNADRQRYARDLLEDPDIRRIDAAFVPLVALGLVIPGLIGWAWTGTWAGALGGFLWGGLVRVFLVHHITWSINSVCHMVGRRRFGTDDRSTNVFWLAAPSLGEAWHNNHHAFPRSARHGLAWWELDLSGMFIGLLERLGLASEVVRVTPAQMEERRARPAPGSPGRGPARRRRRDSSQTLSPPSGP